MDYSPLKDEIRSSIEESLHDDETKKRLQSIITSRTWKRIEEFLVFRREQLYAESPTTTEMLWKREGALNEVQALLRRGPLLVLQWQQWKEVAGLGVISPAAATSTSTTDDGLG